MKIEVNTFTFPTNNEVACPICGEKTEKAAILIPIKGTQEGNISEAILVHIKCLLSNCIQYYPQQKAIAGFTKE